MRLLLLGFVYANCPS